MSLKQMRPSISASTCLSQHPPTSFRSTAVPAHLSVLYMNSMGFLVVVKQSFLRFREPLRRRRGSEREQEDRFTIRAVRIYERHFPGGPDSQTCRGPDFCA